jgi:hypothetical protein
MAMPLHVLLGTLVGVQFCASPYGCAAANSNARVTNMGVSDMDFTVLARFGVKQAKLLPLQMHSDQLSWQEDEIR